MWTYEQPPRLSTWFVHAPLPKFVFYTDPEAVVDSKLRVIGAKKLRVIDASVMPRLVGGNTHAPTVMIGEKGADLIIQDYGRKEPIIKKKDEL